MYEGQFCRGERHGRGVLTRPKSGPQPSIVKYEGEFKVDALSVRAWGPTRGGDTPLALIVVAVPLMFGQGFGTATYSNGDVYVGNWLDGQRSGHGTLTSLSGEKYDGSWLKDVRDGFGVSVFSNGAWQGRVKPMHRGTTLGVCCRFRASAGLCS